jgi:hypothetical protein
MVGAGDANGYRCGGSPIRNTKTVIDHIANRSATDPASRTQEYNLKRHTQTEYTFCDMPRRFPMSKKFNQPAHWPDAKS